jgi:hypothetical protein
MLRMMPTLATMRLSRRWGTRICGGAIRCRRSVLKGGLASLDNPTFAIRLQRMGHPDSWFTHILKLGHLEFLDFRCREN